MNKNNETGLRRVIGLRHATAMVVGTIIGASIFVQQSYITDLVPSVSGIFLVWIISGILTLFGSLVCAELSSIFTRSGGVYIYLKEAYSPSVGFLWGWAMFWTMHSGIIAVVAVICSRYVGYFFPYLSENNILYAADLSLIFFTYSFSLSSSQIVAVCIILILSAINYIGVKQGSALQTYITMGKIGAIVLIIALGTIYGSRVPEHFVSGNLPEGSDVTLNGFFLALVAGLFAFGGWHMVTYNSEETIESRKTIPRALILGTLIVTVCYISLNAVYMYILSLEEIASSKRIAADAADVLFGFGGGAFMSALVIFSTFGALSGIILAGPRVYYSMSQDGLLFKWASEVHPKFRTPHKAILLQAIWASVLVATGTFRALFIRVIYTEWIFFGIMAIGLFIFRRRPELKRGYSIWGYPVVPLIFIISSFIIVGNQILSDPKESIIGLSYILAGLPVYYIWARKSKKDTQLSE